MPRVAEPGDRASTRDNSDRYLKEPFPKLPASGPEARVASIGPVERFLAGVRLNEDLFYEMSRFEIAYFLLTQILDLCSPFERFGEISELTPTKIERLDQAIDLEAARILHRALRTLWSRADFQFHRPSISQTLRTQVMERDFYRCLICGTHKDLAVDHIIPVAAGGFSVLGNLQTLCNLCNSRKRDRI